MTEIFLIRHGETAWNAERRLQGHLDIPLNEEGRRQAAALGRAMAGESIDAIFSSDLSRANSTAQAVAEVHGLPLQTDPALRERCFGAFEGLLYEELEGRYPEAHAQWRVRDPHARYPDGERRAETFAEFAQRAVDAVCRIAESQRGKRIVIVSHGGVLDCVYRAAHDMDISAPRDFDVLNASINRIRWDGERLHVLRWSDDSHLSAALDELGN
ncbi:MAG: histidine phosphatase family protein [Noviherbaspirillum sp.]